MLTAPSACAAVVAVIVFAFTTATPVAAVPPRVTLAPATNPVPVIATDVPPADGPDVGLTPVTVGAGSVYVNAFASDPDCASGFVTTIPTVAAACAGVVAVMVVLLTTTTSITVLPPMVTDAP